MSVELLVNNWIKAAYDRGASDVHLEPEGDDKLRVRMRVDGDLHHIETVPDAKKVLARVKVMASLDVNERAVPLDGRFNIAEIGGRNGLDVRLSTTPCMGGEKAVLRVIDNSRLGMSLEDLGFTKKMLAIYKPLVSTPNGLLLHVGPTGCGKTTSLYAVIQTLNRPELNIQTVEDPVEYDVQGITQTQVNHELGLSFPKVLRALLRQDPNIILVGEIRDAETAEIATEAAITGHLVLSTLHTNDAVGTVVRLLDMGIAPYGIAYAIRSVVSQRFVRKLCPQCRRSAQPPEHLVKIIGANRPVYTAEGCPACKRTGFQGRAPIFELMPMTAPLRKAIYASASPDELAQVAAQSGLISLWQDGLDKALGGLTSVEEVMRVVKGVRELPKGSPRPVQATPTPRATGRGAPRPQAKPAPGARPAARPPAAAKPPGA
ncbi:type II/IV secretion system protein [bacterium]|nr:type II/IV secretion system protein [bacterium]